MQINDELMNHLEELSRLRLTPEEKAETKQALSRALDYIGKLSELNLGGVDALPHPFPEANRFREDIVEPSLERERLLANAPKQRSGCFETHKTLEQEERACKKI